MGSGWRGAPGRDSGRGKIVKKLGVVSILLLCVIVVFYAALQFHFVPRSVYSLLTADIDLSEENINGVKPGLSIRDKTFIRQYGNELVRSGDHVDHTYYLLKDGVEIATKKGDPTILRIQVTSQSDPLVKTSKGIAVGDPLEKVKKAYGDHFYTRSEQGINIVGYVDDEKTLEFWHWENHVQMIRYDFSSMK
jgi:hypothetical protein